MMMLISMNKSVFGVNWFCMVEYFRVTRSARSFAGSAVLLYIYILIHFTICVAAPQKELSQACETITELKLVIHYTYWRDESFSIDIKKQSHEFEWRQNFFL